jgi:hypothetical protein
LLPHNIFTVNLTYYTISWLLLLFFYSAIFLDLLDGAFRDLSGNLVVPKNDSRMIETPDNTGPTFRSSGPQFLDYSEGVLILRAHKTLEISPYVDATDPIDLSKFFLSNSSDSDDVQLVVSLF